MINRLLSLVKNSPTYELFAPLEERLWLLRAAQRNSFSQHGEDQFFSEYFRGTKGTYIDVGASHPFKISNTYLLYTLGWSGVTVEPITRLSRKHTRIRPRDIQLNCVVGEQEDSAQFYELTPGVLSTCDPDRANILITQGRASLYRRYQVQITTLQNIWQRSLSCHEVTLLSIDSEGHELSILRGADWTQFRPRLVVLENNNSGDDNSSDAIDYLLSRGYRVINSFGCNTVLEALS